MAQHKFLRYVPFLTARGGGWRGCGLLLLVILLLPIPTALYAVDTTTPEVTLFAPLGGEGIENTEYLIRWQATDDTGLSSKPVKISYSIDGGSSYTVITSDTENDGKYW